jgi:archaellum biogenesis protein FlaJ (TadC family)
MGFYTKISFRFFSQVSEQVSEYFSELKQNLRKARIKLSLQEYLSIVIMTCFVVFLSTFPAFAMFFGFIFAQPVLAFVSALSLCLGLTVATMFVFLQYPKILIAEKAKSIDNALPFAALYLSTVASSKLPLHKIFEIFSKYSEYGELTNEIKSITTDMEIFGADINTALERGIERSPSKALKEMLWGILSTIQSGGDLSKYLKEVSVTLINEYRRKLYEFSHQLTLYIEVYLTAMVLGAIFFTILSSILSGLGEGGPSTISVITLQFLIIFIFMPAVSVLFILLVKSITPGEE